MIYDLADRFRFAAEGAWFWLLDAREEAAARPTVTIGALGAIAAGLAIAVVALASGDGSAGPEAETASEAAAPTTAPEAAPTPLVADSQVIDERTFTIALPDGWSRTKPPKGASFSARSGDGFAETTLWIDRDGALGFEEFVDQSLAGLERLGENAVITDQVQGPTLETSIAELEAEVPISGGLAGPYEVTLRAAGDLRYYLATSIAAGAPAARLADAELIGTTFRPAVQDQKAG